MSVQNVEGSGHVVMFGTAQAFVWQKPLQILMSIVGH